MSFESLAFDSLELNDGTTYRLQESLEIAPPPKRLLWIAGREGDILGDVPGYERRTVTARIRIMPAAAMDTALTSLGAITDKLQKAERTNGGISLVWTPAGSTYSKTIKVLSGEITDLPLSPDATYFRRAPYITLRLDCKPFLYGSETSYATVTSSNPHVVAMARSVAGDVSAEGRLILTDMATQERDFAEWGLDPDPITLDALALSYTPSLLLKLGSSSGLTDQSGNGYNGTANGGVTIGGATGLLTGDDATSTDFDGSNDYISTTYTTRRNLLPSPSGEGSTGISAGGVATVTAQSSDGTFYGQRVSKVVTPGTNVYDGILLSASTAVAVVPGDVIGFRALAYCATLPGAGLRYSFGFSYFKADGSYIGGVQPVSPVTAVAATAQDLVQPGLAVPATVGGQVPAFIQPYVTADNAVGAAVAATFLVGARLLEKGLTVGATPGAYFDGSGYINATTGVWTADPGGKVGWLGTAHASASDKGVFANGTVRTFTGVASRDVTSAAHTLIGGSATSSETRIVLASGSGNVLYIVGGTTYTFTSAWPADTNPHTWQLVVAEASDTATLYIDGVLFEAKSSVTAQHAASQSFYIGAHGSASDPFDGKQQDVAVYESGLTADQVRQLHVAGRSPYLFDSAWLSVSGLSGTATTRSGAYDPIGSGNTVLRGSTSPNWVGLCETGALPHYGPFRGKVRLWTDATDAQVRLAYKVGDAPFKRLNPVVLQSGLASNWQEVDLGMVDIAQASLGTQKTVLRVEYKATTAAMTFDVDYIEAIPATRYGKARAPVVSSNPSVFTAASSFTTESGVITGDSLAVGGTWAGSGDADDFSAAGGVAARIASTDADINTGHYAVASGSTLTNCVVQADAYTTTMSNNNALIGLVARYTDTSNWLIAGVSIVSQVPSLVLKKRVAGTVTTLASASTLGGALPLTWMPLRLVVLANGYVEVWFNGARLIWITDSSLATGGTLASGKAGIYDAETGSPGNVRQFRNFAAWAPDSDAAIFSGKTGEFRCDDTLRQDSTGSYYGRPSIARGPGVFIPQAGSESKVTRIVAKACRNDIEVAPRDNIADSTKLEVRLTPRYLVTPR